MDLSLVISQFFLFANHFALSLLGGKSITKSVMIFPPRSDNGQIPYESKWYKNEQIVKISYYFFVHFQNSNSNVIP